MPFAVMISLGDENVQDISAHGIPPAGADGCPLDPQPGTGGPRLDKLTKSQINSLIKKTRNGTETLMPAVVLDTNVLVSGLVKSGKAILRRYLT